MNDEKLQITVDPSALEFYFEAAIPDVPSGVRSMMAKAIRDGLKTRDASRDQQIALAALIDEASHYCDDGHYHDKKRDMAMLPSERLAALKQEQEKQ